MCRYFHKIIFAAGIFVLGGCEKPIESPVPSVAQFEFTINLAAYPPLKESMKAVVIQNYGYNGNGVIIYRHIHETEMYAYDVTCPASADCLERGWVRQDGGNPALCKCQRCGSLYTLQNGIHTQRRVRLRPYNITPVSNTSEHWRVSNR